eukprot:1011051-Alexandrium_andersonii.AAC.1
MAFFEPLRVPSPPWRAAPEGQHRKGQPRTRRFAQRAISPKKLDGGLPRGLPPPGPPRSHRGGCRPP